MTAMPVVPVVRRRWFPWVVGVATILLLSCCIVSCLGTNLGSFFVSRFTASTPQTETAVVPPAVVETPQQDLVAPATPVIAPQTAICPEDIPAGETITVNPGCVVLGDVEVGGQIFYDVGGAGQATVVVVEGQAVSVFAEWGAGVEETVKYVSMAELFDTYVVDELLTGCGSTDGCSEVRFVVFRDKEVVFDQIKR